MVEDRQAELFSHWHEGCRDLMPLPMVHLRIGLLTLWQSW